MFRSFRFRLRLNSGYRCNPSTSFSATGRLRSSLRFVIDLPNNGNTTWRISRSDSVVTSRPRNSLFPALRHSGRGGMRWLAKFRWPLPSTPADAADFRPFDRKAHVTKGFVRGCRSSPVRLRCFTSMAGSGGGWHWDVDLQKNVRPPMRFGVLGLV